MKKLLVSFITLVLTVMLTISFTAVLADSPEILKNTGFEDDVNGWGPGVNCKMVTRKSYPGVNSHTGDYFVSIWSCKSRQVIFYRFRDKQKMRQFPASQK